MTVDKLLSTIIARRQVKYPKPVLGISASDHASYIIVVLTACKSPRELGDVLMVDRRSSQSLNGKNNKNVAAQIADTVEKKCAGLQPPAPKTAPKGKLLDIIPMNVESGSIRKQRLAGVNKMVPSVELSLIKAMMVE